MAYSSGEASSFFFPAYWMTAWAAATRSLALDTRRLRVLGIQRGILVDHIVLAFQNAGDYYLVVALFQHQPLRLLGRNGFDGGAVPLKWDRRRRPVEGNDGVHHPFVPTAGLKVYRRRLPPGSGPSTAAVLISG